MSNPNIDAVLNAISDLKDDMRQEVGDVKAHLKTLNDRTRKVEASTQTQWVLWKILGALGLVLIPIIITGIVYVVKHIA